MAAKTNTASTTSAVSHDHRSCLDTALVRAHAAFEGRGLKLTPLRRQVFEEIAGSHDAIGAYDVLDSLIRKTGERMAPISVYRAIDALLECGVVHRLESRNAFFACHTPHAGKRHIALVCDACGLVAEIDGTDVMAAIDAAASRTRFRVKLSVVEVAGTCANCEPTRGG